MSWEAVEGHRRCHRLRRPIEGRGPCRSSRNDVLGNFIGSYSVAAAAAAAAVVVVVVVVVVAKAKIKHRKARYFVHMNAIETV